MRPIAKPMLRTVDCSIRRMREEQGAFGDRHCCDGENTAVFTCTAYLRRACRSCNRLARRPRRIRAHRRSFRRLLKHGRDVMPRTTTHTRVRTNAITSVKKLKIIIVSSHTRARAIKSVTMTSNEEAKSLQRQRLLAQLHQHVRTITSEIAKDAESMPWCARLFGALFVQNCVDEASQCSRSCCSIERSHNVVCG
jgi:hypothetical protein